MEKDGYGKGKSKGKGMLPSPNIAKGGDGKGKTVSAKPDWREKQRQRENVDRKQRMQEVEARITRVNIRNLPSGSLDDPRWETAFAAEVPADSSNRIIFIATKSGGFCVKASSKTAEECFAVNMLRHLGVRTPNMRLVCQTEDEWNDIDAAVKACAVRAKLRGDNATASSLEQQMDRLLTSILCIYHLVPNSAPLLNNSSACSFFQMMPDQISHELEMIGRCLAVDVLLNNEDRFMAPCWDNEGNAQNILLAACVKKSDKSNIQIVAIGTASTCSPRQDQTCHAYLNRVQIFLQEVCKDATAVNALRQLQTFIEQSCGARVDDAALSEVRRGVLQVIAKVAEDSFTDWLMDLHAQIEPWQSSAAQRIDISFLKEVVGIFREVHKLHNLQSALEDVALVPSVLDAVAASLDLNQAGVSDELWEVLPCAIQEELSNQQDKPFQILVMQMKATTAFACAREVKHAVEEDFDRTAKKAGLVLLPENVISNPLRTDITYLLSDSTGSASPGVAPPELRDLAEVAKEHCIYIVCGTMIEPKDRKRYVTSIVIGPDGRGVGAYRKRMIHDHQVQLKGDRPFVFTVPGLGKAAVLICYDAEDKALRDEILGLGVRCVLNPIHIPGPPGEDPEQHRNTWRTAINQMAEGFTHICHNHGITWVRCDLPGPLSGMGSSQVIGPEITHRACSLHAETLSVCLWPSPVSAGRVRLFARTPELSYERSDPKQNCGPRCTVCSWIVKGKLESVRFCRSSEISADVLAKKPPVDRNPLGDKSNRPDRMVLVFDDQSVRLLHTSGGFVNKDVPCGPSEYSSVVERLIAENGGNPASEDRHNSGCSDMCKKISIDLISGELIIQRVRIPSGEPFHRIAVDEESGILATVSWIDDDRSKVSIWTFSHNCIPFPLIEFLQSSS